MHVLISVDMEGCAGVVHVDQTRRTGHDFALARHWMTGEANAAALGAFEAGATRVVINDSHADMRNLLIDELDPRVEVISGSLKLLSMAQGLGTAKVDAMFMVGYHGGAGARASVLDHTYYGAVVSEVRVRPARVSGADDGIWMDEAALNALVAGELGTPVALVTGDQTVTASARERFVGVTTVQVKTSLSRFAAQSLHPATAREKIREGATRAIAGLSHTAPYRLEAPLTLAMRMLTTGFADAAEIVPGVTRIDATRIEYTAPTARELLRAVLAITKVAGTFTT